VRGIQSILLKLDPYVWKQQQAFVQPILYTPIAASALPVPYVPALVGSGFLFPDDRLGMQIVPYLDLFQNPDVVPQGNYWG